MAIKQKKINEELQRVDQLDSSIDTFGLAVYVDEAGTVKHSGLILCYDEVIYFLHFTGKVLLESPEPYSPDLFFKELKVFPEYYFPYIKANFELIVEKVHPKYGYVISDSWYNNEWEYVTEVEGMPDFATCVGFCINIIRGLFYNKEKYLEVTDWDETTLEEVDPYTLKFTEDYIAKVMELSPEQMGEIRAKSFRRILPVELTASGFYDDLPVRKQQTDSILKDVNSTLRGMWIASESEEDLDQIDQSDTN